MFNKEFDFVFCFPKILHNMTNNKYFNNYISYKQTGVNVIIVYLIISHVFYCSLCQNFLYHNIINKFTNMKVQMLFALLSMKGPQDDDAVRSRTNNKTTVSCTRTTFYFTVLNSITYSYYFQFVNIPKTCNIQVFLLNIYTCII